MTDEQIEKLHNLRDTINMYMNINEPGYDGPSVQQVSDWLLEMLDILVPELDIDDDNLRDHKRG